MGKILIILLVLAALQFGWTVHNEGLEHAYGGVLAPLVGKQAALKPAPRPAVNKRAASQTLRRTGRPSEGSVAHGMRDRVNAAMGNSRRRADGR